MTPTQPRRPAQTQDQPEQPCRDGCGHHGPPSVPNQELAGLVLKSSLTRLAGFRDRKTIRKTHELGIRTHFFVVEVKNHFVNKLINIYENLDSELNLNRK